MLLRTRILIAALLGLSFANLTPAQEPGRLGLDRPASAPQGNPNQLLADTLAKQLRQGGRLRRYHIDLACRNGVVEVSGTVADQSQREEALRLIQGVPGVEKVIDRLQLVNESIVRTQADNPPQPPLPLLPPPVEAEKKKEGFTEPLPMMQGGGPNNPQFDLNPPRMPPYAWPTYSPYPNFSRVAYPEAYPYNAWPFIGPIYPFPKVPLGWRAVKLEFEDGYWWFSRTATKHDWWRLRFW